MDASATSLRLHQGWIGACRESIRKGGRARPERGTDSVAPGTAGERPLVEEVRWFRSLFARLYHAIPDVPGTEELQAELEREAAQLGLIKAGKPDLR